MEDDCKARTRKLMDGVRIWYGGSIPDDVSVHVHRYPLGGLVKEPAQKQCSDRIATPAARYRFLRRALLGCHLEVLGRTARSPALSPSASELRQGWMTMVQVSDYSPRILPSRIGLPSSARIRVRVLRTEYRVFFHSMAYTEGRSPERASTSCA